MMSGEAVKSREAQQQQEDEARRAAASASQAHEVLIEPSRGWAALRLRELWEYRELLYFLAWRDIKIRYKQTALGLAWAILQPFLTMLIFAVFFGKLARMPSDNVPYPLFAFAALVPWTFFANGLTQSSNSLVGSANLIKKVYFPRLVVPISVVLGGLPDFALSFLVLLGMMAYYGVAPQLAIVLWLPLLLLLALVTALGTGLWLSALNVKYRDVRYIVGFLTQIWMFATPVVYPASLLSGRWRLVYSLNPMVGVVEGFRWALLRTETAPGMAIVISATMSLLILVTGTFYFRRMEKTFADIV
ncbi:MAG TPA: ABC transporter permease [Pyrinomonadaceae bacterium]|jgi:lipopolysaccharide transport system permease protein